MMVRRLLKRAILGTGKSLGAFNAVGSSRWRNSRLLILGYHGVSLEDEHEWDGSLYMSPENFHSRMKAIKRRNCNVLPLEEALDLLSTGKLPARSVVLTFDDGSYDFYKAVCPILDEYRYPSTLYFTTYWMTLQLPVVPVTWRYIIWKGRESVVDASSLLKRKMRFDLRNEGGRAHALDQLGKRADHECWTGEQRDQVSRQLAQLVGFDYWEFRSKRMLQLLRPEELKSVAAAGVSIQLHTHHHRIADQKQSYIDEISENRRQITAILHSNPNHFCYPRGQFRAAKLPWLREAGVISATTCEPGMTSVSSEPLLLPRLIDTSFLTEVAFEGWLVGFGGLLPSWTHRHRRSQKPPDFPRYFRG